MAITDSGSSVTKPHLILDDILAASATSSSTSGKYLASECFFILECRICFNLFRSVAAFVAHKEKTCIKFASKALNADKPPTKEIIVCQPCEREFVSLAMKQRHDEYFHSVNSPVKKAPLQSDLRSKLMEGLQKSNIGANPANYGMQCQQCTKWFATADALKRHLNFDCPNMGIQSSSKHFSGKRANTSVSEQNHKTNKNAKKPNSNNERITRSHQQVFNCDYCHRMYSDQASLQKHVDVFHRELVRSQSKGHETVARSGAKRQRVVLENQENTRPVSKQMKSDITDGNADDISIYCDDDAMQCLICLAQLDSVETLRDHIRVEHSSSPANKADAADVPTDWGDFEHTDLSNSSSHKINLECSVCGKKFKCKPDYDYHITLPHKILIRK